MKNAATGGQKLRISGYWPAAQLQKGAMHLTVSANGAPFPAVRIEKGGVPFAFARRGRRRRRGVWFGARWLETLL
jgi:hypothetical protein